MTEVEELVFLLKKKENLAAMVAPTFPILYSKEELITKLRSLGFQYIVEVSAGAVRTNETIKKLLQENPTSRYITSPCASFVRLVRAKYPHLLKYLTLQADTPMSATAKLVNEKYPGYRPVFIGPCIAKKKEASEDYSGLNMLVITFKELEEILKATPLPSPETGHEYAFDLEEKSTRIYPFDGGLTESSGIRSLLKENEIRIVSGYLNCETALKEFETNKTIRFLDILFCEGGCINGTGIQSTLSLSERKSKVVEYSLIR